MKKSLLFAGLLLAAVTFHAAEVKWALTNVPENSLFNGFHDGIAVCYDTVAKKYGAIDTNGDVIIPFQYDYLSDFNGDGAIARTAEGEGIIGDNNQYLLEPNSEWKISSIVTDNEASQMLRNSFLVVNESAQTQAIFYKDRLITDFTPVHSIAYDIQFPFIQIDFNNIINTETDDIVNSIYDMGAYFLTENAEGEISAISRFTGENITASVIGDNISVEEARSFAMAISKDPLVGAQTAEQTESAMASAKNQYFCSLTHENGLWNMTTQAGEVKLSLKDEDGWICKMPFYQNYLVWFERNIPNTDSTQIKVVYISGLEYLTKSFKGSARLRFYPTYMRVFGHTMIAYSTPHICITEVSPEGIETKTSIECIIRGSSILAKAKAAQERKFASYSFNGGDFVVCGNYLMYKEEGTWNVYDIDNDKKYPAKEIVDYSEDMILAIDPAGQYFAIQTENGKKTALKYQHIDAYNDGVAFVDGKAGKAIIDMQGKILAQESKDLAFVDNQSSENVIVALNKKTNRIGFMYNPLVKDTLVFNTGKKLEQLYAKGINHYQKRQYGKAKQCFQRITKHDPMNVDAIVKYADCMTGQKYYVAAIYQYNRALRLDPSNKEAADHLEYAQLKKEQAEYAAAMTRAICQAIYDGLSAANDVLTSGPNYSTSYTSTGAAVSSNSGKASDKGSSRNDSNYRFSLMRTYSDYENQISKMKTYPETYNDSDRRYIQSKMKSIRAELESRGYTQRKSEWEDWNGR